jgi:excisionase family DNA binding protein
MARLSNIESLLLSIHGGGIKFGEQNSSDLLNVRQAAEFLSLAVPTIYTLVSKAQENGIPYHKPKGSKRIYFSRTKLTEWVASGRNEGAEASPEAGGLIYRHKKRGWRMRTTNPLLLQLDSNKATKTLGYNQPVYPIKSMGL